MYNRKKCDKIESKLSGTAFVLRAVHIFISEIQFFDDSFSSNYIQKNVAVRLKWTLKSLILSRL